VVSEVGVDRSDFLAVLDEQRDVMAKTVIEEHNEAIEQGITAVPTVLINNVLPVPGAQDSASYIQWIQSLIDRQSN
jgi:predicted DsbA family dithiol-disulfide isomerase